jgi:hypothetical protein
MFFLYEQSINLGVMTEAMWEGDAMRDEQGSLVFYRERGTRNAEGKPERDIVPMKEAVMGFLRFYSDQDSAYDTLMADLATLLDTHDDDYDVPKDDLTRILKPHTEDRTKRWAPLHTALEAAGV